MTTLVTYSLQVISPNADYGMVRGIHYALPLADQRVLSNLPALIEAAEEDLSDLLPDGYEVRIVEAMT